MLCDGVRKEKERKSWGNLDRLEGKKGKEGEKKKMGTEQNDGSGGSR